MKLIEGDSSAARQEMLTIFKGWGTGEKQAEEGKENSDDFSGVVCQGKLPNLPISKYTVMHHVDSMGA